MKYWPILCILPAFILTGCQKHKFYTCICNASGKEVAVYRMGRMEKTEAYERCHAYTDSATSCYMEIRN
jgi:hypothetical protein